MGRAAFIEAARDPSFPKKTPEGWPIASCKAWLKKHARGPYRNAAPAGKSKSLAAAKLAFLEERTAHERIIVQRESLAQAIELGQVVWQEDVLRIYAETVGTACTCLDAFHEHVDRALMEAPDEVRERVLTTLDRCVRQLRDGMVSLLGKGESDGDAA